MLVLILSFWPHWKAGFEVSERNKDSSYAPTAHKLNLDALHTIRVAAFPARASPNWFWKQNRGEEERRERKEKKGMGDRGERKKRCQQTPTLLNGSNAARAYELCSFAKRCTNARVSFFYFLRTILLRRRGYFLVSWVLPARKCSKMHTKAFLQQWAKSPKVSLSFGKQPVS